MAYALSILEKSPSADGEIGTPIGEPSARLTSL
ncbi:hypothetical protein SMQC19_18250 [Serratia marcescens]|jgi:hypothetical protein|nr:Uncharacterised protein [Serratia marcescens]CAI1658894.1 Uncharacterised protein [Serratia marcescens]CAI2075728.1 Uncharacterised protein [Serratia marcescens]CUY96317.1 Uncharacterised protein [Serratia marcescens]SUJ15964.1 Uncharacterised protein [Serratia marcescens]